MHPSHLIKILQHFRELDPDVPVSTILCFLWLMENPGMTVGDAVKFLGLTKQSASRNMANLTHRRDKNKAGMDLVIVTPDPQDIRVKRHMLNDRGKELAQAVKEILKN